VPKFIARLENLLDHGHELYRACWVGRQERHSKDKLYSLLGPEVVCLAKGKANKAYEFGAKVSWR
jgi:hypothetical protein